MWELGGTRTLFSVVETGKKILPLLLSSNTLSPMVSSPVKQQKVLSLQLQNKYLYVSPTNKAISDIIFH